MSKGGAKYQVFKYRFLAPPFSKVDQISALKIASKIAVKKN
jgi:hypothetical protein